MVSHCEIYKQHFLGKKSRASGSDSSGDEKREGGGTMLEKTFPSIQRYQD